MHFFNKKLSPFKMHYMISYSKKLDEETIPFARKKKNKK